MGRRGEFGSAALSVGLSGSVSGKGGAGADQATSSSTASILGSAEHQAGAQDGVRRAGRAGKGLSAACPPQEAGGRMMQQGLPPGALGGEFITEMCLRSARRRQPLGLPSLMLSLGFLGPP